MNTRRDFLKAAGLAAVWPARAGVRDFGAVGDGVRLDTAAIQKAIDACSAAGGGTLHFPAGRYLTGTIFLKSRVTLELEAGSVLLGSRKLADYPVTVPALRTYTDSYTDKSLIYAEKAEDIAIRGRGTIDGQGAAFEGPYKVRPYTIRVIQCRNVSIEGVTIRDSPMWVQHYLDCDGVSIRDVTVRSRVNHNNDGIDIDGCRRVRISDCDIWSGDDAIVLKSTFAGLCRDVTVTNCVISSNCNALKLGTESNGGFENIVMSNCTVYDNRLAGIALEMVDGGTLDRVIVSNIVMNKVGAPIFMRLGNRARPYTENGPRPGMGSFRNVIVSNVEATGCGPTGCALAGLPGHPIENVTVENVRLSFDGGGKLRTDEVPEFPEKYPEFGMFGKLPAYGLYCRHARNLSLRNVRTSVAAADPRPALVCDDVKELELKGFTGAKRFNAVTEVSS